MKSNQYGTTFKSYKIICELSRTQFCITYKVEPNEFPGQILILKELPITKISAKNISEIITNFKLYRKISHLYLVKYYSTFIDNEKFYILSEFTGKNDLQTAFFVFL